MTTSDWMCHIGKALGGTYHLYLGLQFHTGEVCNIRAGHFAEFKYIYAVNFSISTWSE